MRPPPDWKGVNAMADNEEPKPKKPNLWSRIANSKAVAKVGEVVGQAKFGQ